MLLENQVKLWYKKDGDLLWNIKKKKKQNLFRNVLTSDWKYSQWFVILNVSQSK